MNKSLAETVNFAEGVQKKAYEKRAQQVDTFVKSETAEQKLARSGKMQTAKALEALASLSGSVIESEAKKSERQAALIKEDLANITAGEIQEQRSGTVPYSSDTFKNLPLRFQTKVASGVGFERGRRHIEEAEANLTDFHHRDDTARLLFLLKYKQSLHLESGMDAHELVGYNKAWQEGEDRINNASDKAKIAHNRKKVETDYKSEVSYIVNQEEMAYDALEDASDAPISSARAKILREQSTKRIYASVETHFQNYSNDVGIEVPSEVKKRWVREQIIQSAKDTDNLSLLLKENRPTEYLDDTSNYLFAQAAIELRDQIESNERANVIAMKAQKELDVMNGIQDIHNENLSWKTPDKTPAQITALNQWDNLAKDGEGAYATNKQNFMTNVKRSVTIGSNVLLDMDDNPILNAAGASILLTREGLQGYVNYNPMFDDADQGYLVDNLDSLLVGFDTAANFPTARIDELIKDSEFKVPETQLRRFIDKEGGKVKEEYRITYSNLRETTGWGKPLTPPQIETFNNEFVNSWLAGELDKLNDSYVEKQKKVDLNGNKVVTEPTKDQSETGDPVDTVETEEPVDTVETEEPVDTVETEEPVDTDETEDVETDDNPEPENQFKFDDLSSEYKDAWEKIKNNTKQVKKWKAAGYPLPYKSDEELISLADERNIRVNTILEGEGITNDKLFDLIFNEMHHKHGDGLRFLDWSERKELKNLNLSKKEMAFLEDQITHTIASDFINSAAEKASSTLDRGDWAKWRKYAKDVMENPYNVYQYDDWMEGDETAGMKGTGLDKENILGPAREYDWFDPRIFNNDKEYK
jgi:hypothetical protein